VRAVLAILVAAAMAVLLPRLALAFFAYPSADDYCIVFETRQNGFWYMQVHSYLMWTGRYSAVFLESILSQVDIASVYPWFAALTILATLASIRMLVATLFAKAVSSIRITAIATIVTAVVVVGLPSGVEAFYWMPGAASYWWGVITYLVWLSLLIRMARRDTADGRESWRRILLVMLTVVVSGFNEVMAPIIFATIIAFVAVNRSQPIASDRFVLALLGVAIICTAISFMAPGNTIRSRVYPELSTRHNLEYALVETARQTRRFIVRFGAYPALWLGALAVWWWSDRVRPVRLVLQRRVASILATLVGLIVITYLTLFPLYWEYGAVNYTGEGRTYNITYLVLIAIVMVVAGLVIRPVVDRLGRRWQERRAPRTSVDVALAAAIAIALLAAPSTRDAYYALQIAPRYLEEEQRRARVLRRAAKTELVFVDKITVRPAGLFWGDVEPDESHWINVCVANYYGVRGVRSRL
jgi:hypothetical protein